MPARSKKSKQATTVATAAQQNASDNGVEASASKSDHTWWSEWLRRWWIDSISNEAEEAKQVERRFFSRERLQPLLKVAGTLITASVGTHLLLVIFGAHIDKYVAKTYLLALLLVILAVLPPTYLLGPPGFGVDNASLVKRWTWVRMFAELSARNPIERSIIYPSVGTVVGCWLGIIPIALDWERPWQAWPLTPAYGAILGYIIASIAALTANAMELTQGSPPPAITTT
ncbi:GPI biosynthesis protein family Pig-F-domain-containing protein [Coprinopsis sp. MPI-PUGE-AT-0042]|nr:GPI biosynthesis protein family Pig-F-domain-containing protein [Coprinopsis sp. MPI-PUGE-AT-0042]